MICKVCGELLRWHILLGVMIPAPEWHSITEGFLKPSDIVDTRGVITKRTRTLPPRRLATQIRPA